MSSLKNATAASMESPFWKEILDGYADDVKVRQVIFVQYQSGSNAIVKLYEKNQDDWQLEMECPAYVGKNGLGKEIEGDGKTPIGDFGIFTAAGIEPNPGAKAKYLLLDEHIFGADGPYYNKILDTRIHPKEDVEKYDGDTFMDGAPQFNYGLFLDYNKECIIGKGSYIFMHCTGSNHYTHGCVAVSEKNMIHILQHVDDNVRVCIYPKGE